MSGDTLRPPPPPPAPRQSSPSFASPKPPFASAGAAAATMLAESDNPAVATAAAAAAASPAAAHEEADSRPRDVELAYLMHKAGARSSPFVDSSAHDLQRWVKRSKVKEPWRVRYGEDGRPRWMKRVLPEWRNPAAAAAAAGDKDGEVEDGKDGEGDR